MRLGEKYIMTITQLPEISAEFFQSLAYLVVDAANPGHIICDLPLSAEEAHDLARELNQTSFDVQFIVVEWQES